MVGYASALKHEESRTELMVHLGQKEWNGLYFVEKTTKRSLTMFGNNIRQKPAHLCFMNEKYIQFVKYYTWFVTVSQWNSLFASLKAKEIFLSVNLLVIFVPP